MCYSLESGGVYGVGAYMRIGLLGGSFNPAHDGHYQISLQALKQCQLDQVWWLITPQNPLKNPDETRPYSERVAHAKQVISHPRIRVKQYEKRWHSNRTLHTMMRIYKQHPTYDFVWIMGADNLVTCHEWYQWERVFSTVPVIVFDRGADKYRAVKSKAAQTFASSKQSLAAVPNLSTMCAPAWVMVHQRKIPISSTAIREKKEHS